MHKQIHFDAKSSPLHGIIDCICMWDCICNLIYTLLTPNTTKEALRIAYAIYSAHALLNTDALSYADALPNAGALQITHAGARASAPWVAYVLEITGIYRILLLV